MSKKHKKKYLGIFPLFRGFKSTNILRAFILNSVAIAIIAVFTVEIKQGLDNSDLNNPLVLSNCYQIYKVHLIPIL